MNELTNPIVLNPGSIMSNSLLVPTDPFLREQRVSVGFFKKVGIVSTTKSHIARITASGGNFCAFDPFATKKIDRKNTEAGVTFRDGVLRLLSQDMILESTPGYESALEIGIEKGLLRQVSYDEAYSNLDTIISRGNLGEEKDFQKLMLVQISNMREKLSDIGFHGETVFQVFPDIQDAVCLFPKDFSRHKGVKGLPDFRDFIRLPKFLPEGIPIKVR